MRDTTFRRARSLLQLDDDYTPEQLKSAYRRAVRTVPPDRHPERFQRVRAAYELLRSPLEGRATWLLARYPHCPPPLARSAPPDDEATRGSALARTALHVFAQSQRLEDLLPGTDLDRVDTDPNGTPGGSAAPDTAPPAAHDVS